MNQIVRLAEVLPDVGFPDTITVTVKDALDLDTDFMLYGNGFIKPSGKEQPTHVRVPPPHPDPK